MAWLKLHCCSSHITINGTRHLNDKKGRDVKGLHAEGKVKLCGNRNLLFMQLFTAENPSITVSRLKYILNFILVLRINSDVLNKGFMFFTEHDTKMS